MIPKASELSNDQWTTLSLKVPNELDKFMNSEKGIEWVSKMQLKTKLFNLRFEKNQLVLTGDKERVTAGFRLIDFSIQHLSELENVKRRKGDMQDN